MKKLGFALIVMLAILALLAVGCGGGGEATPTATTVPGTTSAPGATATPQATATPAETHGELPGSYKYTMEFSSSDGSSGAYKVWIKGNKSRLEMTFKEAGGEESTTIWLDDGQTTYWYTPEDNSAMKFPTGEDSGLTSGLDLGFFSESYTEFATEKAAKDACAADPDCKSVKVVGQETYKGERVIIYEWVGTEGSVKMWVSKDNGWPVKWEGTAPDGTTQVMEFSGIDLNPNIPDSTFQLPSGVEITELPY